MKKLFRLMVEDRAVPSLVLAGLTVVGMIALITTGMFVDIDPNVFWGGYAGLLLGLWVLLQMHQETMQEQRSEASAERRHQELLAAIKGPNHDQ